MALVLKNFFLTKWGASCKFWGGLKTLGWEEVQGWLMNTADYHPLALQIFKNNFRIEQMAIFRMAFHSPFSCYFVATMPFSFQVIKKEKNVPALPACRLCSELIYKVILFIIIIKIFLYILLKSIKLKQ